MKMKPHFTKTLTLSLLAEIPHRRRLSRRFQNDPRRILCKTQMEADWIEKTLWTFLELDNLICIKYFLWQIVGIIDFEIFASPKNMENL